MADEPFLPKLIKLLRLSTSDNDSEALAAIRAANTLLHKHDYDWEPLLRGKVTIIADPFEKVSAPPTSKREARPMDAPPTPRGGVRNYSAGSSYTPPQAKPSPPPRPWTPPSSPRGYTPGGAPSTSLDDEIQVMLAKAILLQQTPKQKAWLDDISTKFARSGASAINTSSLSFLRSFTSRKTIDTGAILGSVPDDHL